MEEKQTFEEFRKRFGHKKGDPFKVTDSFGVYDCYKLMRKNHWYDIGRPVLEKEFYAIVRGINDLLAENITNGETVVLPKRMGRLELRKFKRGVTMKNGKLKITYPINWLETQKLWYNDEEAMKEKVLIRFEEPYVYHVKYCTQDAVYENKIFYQFDLNTFIKRALKKKIKSGKTDTLW